MQAIFCDFPNFFLLHDISSYFSWAIIKVDLSISIYIRYESIKNDLKVTDKTTEVHILVVSVLKVVIIELIQYCVSWI